MLFKKKTGQSSWSYSLGLVAIGRQGPYSKCLLINSCLASGCFAQLSSQLFWDWGYVPRCTHAYLNKLVFRNFQSKQWDIERFTVFSSWVRTCWKTQPSCSHSWFLSFILSVHPRASQAQAHSRMLSGPALPLALHFHILTLFPSKVYFLSS